MWYVIQTLTGREKELVGVIDKIVDRGIYEKCFVIQSERVWRVAGQYRAHLEPLFPSYVFVATNAPKDFFFSLKKISRQTKLLRDGEDFWTVRKEEEELLRRMTGDDGEYTVRRPLVHVNQNGEILSAEGVLGDYLDKITKKRLRKRIIVIEIPFFGETRRIQLGIRLETDHEY